MTPSPAIRACSEALHAAHPSKRGLAIALTAREYGRTASDLARDMALIGAESRRARAIRAATTAAAMWYADRD